MFHRHARIKAVPTEQQLRISHVGLRGAVGAGLTASLALDFASAFGTFLEPGKPVFLGRDPRASGVMLREGAAAALMACGHHVVDLGVVSTPIVQHAIQRLDGAGGISIGASYNHASWNALRFFGPRGTYLSTAEASELLDIYHLRKFNFAEWNHLGGFRSDTTALDAYLTELAAAHDFAKLRKYRVVADCCNGAAALILREMNRRFGFDFILLNERIEDVAFAHDPVTSAKMVALQLAPLMKPLRADAGFLFDIDSDRVAIATGEGEAVSEEMILPILADYLLPRGPGKIIIANLSTTALLDDIAAKHGGRVVRAAVGRQAAIDALSGYRPEQIAIAGEGTGAVMMPRFRFVYDGIAAMLTILSMMDERGQSLAEIVRGYPKYSILKGEIKHVSRQLPSLLMDLQQEYADGRIDRGDGLRVSWPDRWFHIRASATEPIVRVICEAKGDSPVAWFGELMGRVRGLA